MLSTLEFHAEISSLIDQEGLPSSFIYNTVEPFYIPLAASLAERHRQSGQTTLVAVNGAQGTGKSTLTAFLCMLLEKQHDLSAASFSLDDIYLTREQRRELSEKEHPLLSVRGVPGTHDIALGLATLDSLLGANPNTLTPIPAFDKAVDDRRPQDAWPSFQGRPDIIVFEGWCVGAPPQTEADLSTPINTLEKNKDPDGRWRHYVNKRLADEYAELFSRFGILVMIAAPSWEQVYQWRLLQESKLAERCEKLGLDDSKVMSAEEVGGFIQHYERLTRHCLKVLPEKTDYLLTMDEQHRILSLTGLNFE